MKKLLAIVVLGLLLSGNAYAEKITLKCTTTKIFKGIKENTYSSLIGDIDIMHIDTNDKNQISTNSRLYFLYTPPIEGKFARGIYLESIDRFTGDYTLKAIEGTEEDAKIFRENFNKAKIALTQNNSHVMNQLISDVGIKYIHQSKDKEIFNMETKKKCEKVKKKF